MSGELGPPNSGTGWGPRARRRTQAARDRLLSDPIALEADDDRSPDASLRSEIASSWRRSQLSGIDPGASLALPLDPDRQPTPRLLRAATPVLERLSQQLSHTAITLADSSSWLVWRDAADHRLLSGLDRISAAPGALLAEEVAGTNGLGTVIEVRSPIIVAGPEHYLEDMQDFTCVGVPIKDPLTMRLEGIVALTCHYRDTNEHLLPLVAEAAREIEVRLQEGASTRERALFDAFLRTARSPALAVASMNDQFLFTNAQAAELFDPTDHALLWSWAKDSMQHSRTVTGRLTLSRGVPVDVRCSTVDDGASPAGVLLTMRPGRETRPAARRSLGSTLPDMPVWQRLLDEGCRLLRDRRRLAVLGEQGAGKATFARAIHNLLRPDTSALELDFAVDQVEQFATHARDDDSTAVLRHVDCLDHRQVRALCAHLERSNGRVLLTVDPTQIDPILLSRLIDQTDGALTVPSLRDRRDDIPALIAVLLAELNPGSTPVRCASECVDALRHNDLPGNVAELRRVLSTALAAADGRDVTLDDLPSSHHAVSRQGRRLVALEVAERAAVVRALQGNSWNAEAAAVALGISRATIYRKMKSLNIKRPARG